MTGPLFHGANGLRRQPCVEHGLAILHQAADLDVGNLMALGTAPDFERTRSDADVGGGSVVVEEVGLLLQQARKGRGGLVAHVGSPLNPPQVRYGERYKQQTTTRICAKNRGNWVQTTTRIDWKPSPLQAVYGCSGLLLARTGG